MKHSTKARHATETIWVIIGVALAIIVVFYALIGAIYMHTVKPTYTGVTTCDKINRIEGQLYCMGLMYAEDDNIMLLRGENER